jgi:hypothetical protein
VIKEKSIVLVKIDGEGFILMIDKILGPEKAKIEDIADRLDLFCSKISEKSSPELFDVFKNIVRDELGIDVSMIRADLEIIINSDGFAAPLKKQDNLNAKRYFTDKGNNWLKGELDGYTVYAKVYSEPSQYGIDKGLISKLHIKDKDGKEVVSYDRGWETKPLHEHREIYEKVSKELVIRRLEMNVKEQQQGKRKQSSHER